MVKGPGFWPFAAASLALSLVVGCNSTLFTLPQPGTALSGNWTFTTPSSQANALTLNAGVVALANGTVTAVAHLTGTSCVTATTAISLAGSVNDADELVLTSQPFSGTTLTLKGLVAGTGKSITGATWTFSGGSCSSLGTHPIVSTDYSNINGTYN